MNRRSFFSTLTKLAAVPFAIGLAKVCKAKPPVVRLPSFKVVPGTMTYTYGSFTDENNRFYVYDESGHAHHVNGGWTKCSGNTFTA